MSQEFIIRGLQAIPELTVPVASVRLHGRSLFDLFRVELQDGRHVAAKIVASPAMARTEAAGLQALQAAGAPVPHCYGYSVVSGTPILYMEFLEGSRASRTHAEESLHEDLIRFYGGSASATAGQTPGPGFGWHESNFIGSLAQPNGAHERFADFWWQDRLLAQFEPAHRRGLLEARVGRRLEALLARRNADWQLDRQKPRLVHGDLWGGNLLPGEDGRLRWIDPSVARSHPEQDLAMLALFGSPLSARQLADIATQVGLGPGLGERIPFWQIYPLLVHINIFGSSYVAQLESAIRRYE